MTIKKSIMGNKLWDRPFYRLAGKIARWLRHYQHQQDARRKVAANRQWQSKFNGKTFFEHQLDHGVKINLYQDSVLSRLLYEGFEKEETAFMESVLSEGDTFIDIGANIGLFSLLAAKKVGQNGKVICFEPAPQTFERLQENIQLNRFDQIDARNLGLSDQMGDLVFHTSTNGHDAWNSFAPGNDNKLSQTITVKVSTLDRELEGLDKHRIKLVKLDVEGWEKFVLLGGARFLEEHHPILMVEFTEENTFNAGYMVQELYDIMQNWGYRWYRLEKGQMVAETKRLHYPYDNLIAIKEGEPKH